MPERLQHERGEAQARLMLVLLSLAWGITWPVMKIALAEIPPFGMRLATISLGALVTFGWATLRRRSVKIRLGIAWVHVATAGVLTVVGFTMLSSFAQLATATSRVAILAYTMPIWASLLAWLVLGERLTAARLAALALCIAGLAVLVWPLMASGIPIGIFFAVGAGASWAAGTVYLKWARIEADPLAVTVWQLVAAFLVVAAARPLFEGPMQLWSAHPPALLAVAFTGLVGSGVAYILWFEIITRLPAMTASLGILSVPVVGVAGSALMLGERPTMPDMIGFALIFAAAACVLLQPTAKRPEVGPEPG